MIYFATVHYDIVWAFWNCSASGWKFTTMYLESNFIGLSLGIEEINCHTTRSKDALSHLSSFYCRKYNVDPIWYIFICAFLVYISFCPLPQIDLFVSGVVDYRKDILGFLKKYKLAPDDFFSESFPLLPPFYRLRENAIFINLTNFERFIASIEAIHFHYFLFFQKRRSSSL